MATMNAFQLTCNDSDAGNPEALWDDDDEFQDGRASRHGFYIDAVVNDSSGGEIGWCSMVVHDDATSSAVSVPPVPHLLVSSFNQMLPVSAEHLRFFDDDDDSSADNETFFGRTLDPISEEEHDDSENPVAIDDSVAKVKQRASTSDDQDDAYLSLWKTDDDAELRPINAAILLGSSPSETPRDRRSSSHVASVPSKSPSASAPSSLSAEHISAAADWLTMSDILQISERTAFDGGDDDRRFSDHLVSFGDVTHHNDAGRIRQLTAIDSTEARRADAATNIGDDGISPTGEDCTSSTNVSVRDQPTLTPPSSRSRTNSDANWWPDSTQSTTDKWQQSASTCADAERWLLPVDDRCRPNADDSEELVQLELCRVDDNTAQESCIHSQTTESGTDNDSKAFGASKRVSHAMLCKSSDNDEMETGNDKWLVEMNRCGEALCSALKQDNIGEACTTRQSPFQTRVVVSGERRLDNLKSEHSQQPSSSIVTTPARVDQVVVRPASSSASASISDAARRRLEALKQPLMNARPVAPSCSLIDSTWKARIAGKLTPTARSRSSVWTAYGDVVVDATTTHDDRLRRTTSLQAIQSGNISSEHREDTGGDLDKCRSLSDLRRMSDDQRQLQVHEIDPVDAAFDDAATSKEPTAAARLMSCDEFMRRSLERLNLPQWFLNSSASSLLRKKLAHNDDTSAKRSMMSSSASCATPEATHEEQSTASNSRETSALVTSSDRSISVSGCPYPPTSQSVQPPVVDLSRHTTTRTTEENAVAKRRNRKERQQKKCETTISDEKYSHRQTTPVEGRCTELDAAVFATQQWTAPEATGPSTSSIQHPASSNRHSHTELSTSTAQPENVGHERITSTNTASVGSAETCGHYEASSLIVERQNSPNAFRRRRGATSEHVVADDVVGLVAHTTRIGQNREQLQWRNGDNLRKVDPHASSCDKSKNRTTSADQHLTIATTTTHHPQSAAAQSSHQNEVSRQDAVVEVDKTKLRRVRRRRRRPEVEIECGVAHALTQAEICDGETRCDELSTSFDNHVQSQSTGISDRGGVGVGLTQSTRQRYHRVVSKQTSASDESRQDQAPAATASDSNCQSTSSSNRRRNDPRSSGLVDTDRRRRTRTDGDQETTSSKKHSSRQSEKELSNGFGTPNNCCRDRNLLEPAGCSTASVEPNFSQICSATHQHKEQRHRRRRRCRDLPGCNPLPVSSTSVSNAENGATLPHTLQ